MRGGIPKVRRRGRRVVTVVLLGLGAGAMGLGGCSSPTDPAARAVEGRWEWVRAVGGIAGAERTPATEGYSMTMEFGSNWARVFRDDTLFAETAVEIRSEDASGQTGTVAYQDPILGWPEQSYRVEADSLTLADGCCDGFVYTFRRSS